MSNANAASAILIILLGFAPMGCKRNFAQPAQVSSTSTISEVKPKTGIVLPRSSSLITFDHESRADVDMWLIKLDGTNVAQYPKEPRKLFVGSEATSQAKLLERIGKISIKNPEASYFGIWDWEGLEIHAKVITTAADGSYVMIERFNEPVQQSPNSATNK
jgi:hypothetical protein